MKDQEAKDAARDAAVNKCLDEMFTSGSGTRAERLVLTAKDGRDLGGWSRPPLRDKLADVFDAGIAARDAEDASGGQWEPYWKHVIPAGRYLVQRWDGNMRVQEFYHGNEASTMKEWAKNVIAYMPLPQPYQPTEGE